MNDNELDEILDTWQAPQAPPSLRAGLLSKFAATRPRRLFTPRFRWLAAAAVGAGALALAASVATDGVIGSDIGPWDAGIYVRRTRIVQPPIAKFKWLLMRGGNTGRIWWAGSLTQSVYLYDRFTHRHYGYTWTAQPLGTGQYLFTAGPLDPSVVKEDGPIAPVPQPEPRIVGVGSTIEVNEYVSGNERVYDRFELSGQPLQLETHMDAAQVAVTLTLTNPRLYINGQFALDSGGVAEAKSQTATVDVPGRGRYIIGLGLQANPQFVLAGFADGNTIEFQSGGDRFRIECSAPVAQQAHAAVFLYYQKNAAITTGGFGAGGAPPRSAPPQLETRMNAPEAAITLTLTHPKLYVNGQFALDSGGVVEAKGQTATVDVPGRGRYIIGLGLQANPQFVLAGFADGNTIEFQSGGDRFRIECSAPVAQQAHAAVFLYYQKNAAITTGGFGAGGAPPRSAPPR